MNIHYIDKPRFVWTVFVVCIFRVKYDFLFFSDHVSVRKGAIYRAIMKHFLRNYRLVLVDKHNEVYICP